MPSMIENRNSLFDEDLSSDRNSSVSIEDSDYEKI
jgi:hypothetical protein